MSATLNRPAKTRGVIESDLRAVVSIARTSEAALRSLRSQRVIDLQLMNKHEKVYAESLLRATAFIRQLIDMDEADGVRCSMCRR